MKKILILTLLSAFCAQLFAGTNILSKDYYPANELTSIDCTLSFEDVTIDSIYGDEFVVEVSSNNRKLTPDFSFENGKLTVRSNKKHYFWGDTCHVYIAIPESATPNTIEVSTASGDIDARDFKVETINLIAASGDIVVKNVDSEKEFFLKTASGDISAKNINSVVFSAKSASGDVKIMDSKADEFYSTSSSGNNILEFITSNFLSSSTSSGEIETNGITCEYFNLDSSSGDITIKLTQAPKATSTINTTSGSVDIRLPRSSAFEMRVSSNSGTFDDEFYDEEISPRREFRSKYNGGGTLIQVHTTSGDINLDD